MGNKKIWEQINKNSDDIKNMKLQLTTEDEQETKVPFFTRNKDVLSGIVTILGFVLSMMSLAVAIISFYFVSLQQKEISKNSLNLSKEMANLNKDNLILEYNIEDISLGNIISSGSASSLNKDLYLDTSIKVEGEVNVKLLITQGSISKIFLVSVTDNELSLNDFYYQGKRNDLQWSVTLNSKTRIKKIPIFVVLIDKKQNVYLDYLMMIIESDFQENDGEVSGQTIVNKLALNRFEGISENVIALKVEGMKNYLKEKYKKEEVDMFFGNEEQKIYNDFKRINTLIKSNDFNSGI